MFPHGEETGLNFPYAVIVEIRARKYKATIIESSKAEHSTVNSVKGFVLAFFITTSSRN